MKIVEKFETLVRKTDNDLIALGLFDSYEEAYNEGVRIASSELPNNELVKTFQISKIFVNTDVIKSSGPHF